jgi:alpha-beta hydrolase superfamily lysophospholipase
MLAVAAALLAGSIICTPAPAVVGAPPPDLAVEPVSFESTSGSRLAGWFIAGEPHHGAVLLLHGVRGSRLAMLGRARMLNARGFAVLLFDFQAHGESPGSQITFGFLESRDARAAFDHLRRRVPGERIGVLGTSLGGAAAILSDPPITADAMVLEAVYATLDEALENRLALYLGSFGRYLSPALMWQIEPRLGVDAADMKPAERIERVHTPLLLIAGDADRHAKMQRIYAAANEPKELWVIPGARHVDFHRFIPAEYERRVTKFFSERLSN